MLYILHETKIKGECRLLINRNSEVDNKTKKNSSDISFREINLF